MVMYEDLGTYLVFHKNYAQWNCIQPFLNVANKIVKNHIIIFSKLFGEKRFVKSFKVFPASIRLIKPMQKYPHIIESYACNLKIFVVIDKERAKKVF